MSDELQSLPKLTPVANPLNLVPVSLKEAALDSPTFRATTVHFGDQLDAIERWLETYIKAASRLANEVTSIESLVNSYLTCASPPQQVSEAALDHDYTVLAVRRYGEGAREFWTAVIKWMKKVESTVVDPIKGFIHNELAGLKVMRRTLEQGQRNYDSIIARYSSQSKTKESSSLREDAFQLHEARKAYLKASMDFCVSAPQVRASLDKLLVKVFSDRWREMKTSRDALTHSFARWSSDIERVRGWSREMEEYERVFGQELQIARKQIEEAAELKARPSRELDSYSTSTVPYLSNTSGTMASPKKLPTGASEKQGWLFQRTITGKPSRTLWVRRWFYVKNGVFGWLLQSARSSAVEESEKIGVLLCGVRPAFQDERRFCFEVKTKDSTIILQAETQTELMEWIAAFEVVKRKALENPTSVEGISAGSNSKGAPFAITPPVAPEFAAQTSEHQNFDDMPERAATLGVEPGLITRASTDVRRPGGADKEGESKTEKAARIMEKLDLHRKGSTAPQAAGASPSPIGGIASLIAASHSALPVAPITPSLSVNTDFRRMLMSVIPTNSLAPSTLANPPAPTYLSKSAIVVGAEHGFTLSEAGDGGMPGGLMANMWGSSNWAYVNRLEKKTNRQNSTIPGGQSSQPPSPVRSIGSPETRHEEQPKNIGDLSTIKSAPVTPPISHMKAISISTQDLSSLPQKPAVLDGYPNYYPLSLKAQDAQFRLLFPNAIKEDRLVLVFRATWNPSDQQEFPGRVYVTMNDIYFYSNYLGFVLITGVTLESILEITAAPGKDCDFLFVHLKEGVRPDGATRLTVKTFLEPLKLLQRRLNYLVGNQESDQPAALEQVIKDLIKMEANDAEDSPSMESWEDVSLGTPFDHYHGGRREQDLKTSLHIDGSLFSDPSKRMLRNATKFRLPAHPVEFIPQGYRSPVVEREYDITAKSLFHVLAGDRSAVFQILYCQRSADRLIQGPWTQPDRGHHKREFQYDVAGSGPIVEVVDYQTIDVLNDHLCYVITEQKTAWFLPHSSDFTLILKIVITHVAKSRCKLSLYTRVEWTKPPLIGQGLIESQASAYIQSYASSLADIVSDQGSRLGSQAQTSARKAVQVFGPVGQQTQSVQLLASDLAPADLKGSKRLHYRSLPRLVVYAARRIMIAYFFVGLGWLIQLISWTSRTVTAHRFLITVLVLSAGFNFFYSSRDSWDWWQERKAGQYMARLGVKPNAVMARSIWLKDLDDLVAETRVNRTELGYASGACATAFTNIVGDMNPSSAPSALGNDATVPQFTRSMLARVSRSRQHFGSYRHDLLVGLRLVAVVEREMLQAEWENWVLSESSRCRHIEGMLDKTGGNKTEGLRDWWDRYCGNCMEELKQLGIGS